MKAKIYLKNEKTKERYGLHFEKGVAETDNEYLIKKLDAKGLRVEVEKKEKTINQMNREELIAVATEKGIDFKEDATKKELLELINKADEQPAESNVPGTEPTEPVDPAV